MEKRKRSVNFDDAEVKRLVEHVVAEGDVLLSKKSDIVPSKDKETAWRIISQKLQAEFGHARSWQHVRNKFDKIKFEVRQINTENKIRRFKTGGGPAVPDIVMTPLQIMVASVIPPQITRYAAEHVSDANAESDLRDMDNNQVEILHIEYLDESSGITQKNVRSDLKYVTNDPLQLEEESKQLSDKSRADCSSSTPGLLRIRQLPSLQSTTSRAALKDEESEGHDRQLVNSKKISKWAGAHSELAECKKKLLEEEFSAKEEREQAKWALEMKYLDFKAQREEVELRRARMQLRKEMEELGYSDAEI